MKLNMKSILHSDSSNNSQKDDTVKETGDGILEESIYMDSFLNQSTSLVENLINAFLDLSRYNPPTQIILLILRIVLAIMPLISEDQLEELRINLFHGSNNLTMVHSEDLPAIVNSVISIAKKAGSEKWTHLVRYLYHFSSHFHKQTLALIITNSLQVNSTPPTIYSI